MGWKWVRKILQHYSTKLEEGRTGSTSTEPHKSYSHAQRVAFPLVPWDHSPHPDASATGKRDVALCLGPKFSPCGRHSAVTA